MRSLAQLMILPALACLAACHGVSTELNPRLEITAINLPAELIGGSSVEFSCVYLAEAGAATLSWDFGGGATPNSGGPAPAEGQATVSVQLAEVSEPTEFTLRVELKDNTNPNRHDAMELRYSVSPPPPPEPAD